MPLPKRYALLDRDGTIIEEANYLSDPDGVVLIPGVGRALARLIEAGFGLVVVSNQSGVGRGYYDEAAMDRVNQRMVDLLAEQGVDLNGIYCCVHAPEDDCACRKPKPGLVDRAAAELGFDPSQGFVVGDHLSDVGLARAIGAKAFYVLTGHGSHAADQALDLADHVVDSLVEAVDIVLAPADRSGQEA